MHTIRSCSLLEVTQSTNYYGTDVQRVTVSMINCTVMVVRTMPTLPVPDLIIAEGGCSDVHHE